MNKFLSIIRLGVALSIAPVQSVFAADAAQATSKPNIIYILADDMGYADAGFNGATEISTPNLDRLAAAGAVLKAHYAQPLCSPTRAALLTGRYPTRNGVYSVIKPKAKWGLKLEERTLADALRGAGYETAISGKWHLGEFKEAYCPTRRGFDHQYGLWYGNCDYFTHKRDPASAGTKSSGKGELDWYRNDQPCHEEGYTTDLIGKEACRLIRERDPAKPLFLYLPFNAVHYPYQVPEIYTQPYANLTGIRKTYAGMVAAMDEAIGHVAAAVEEAGIGDNTLIIFSSDNGGTSPGTISDNGPLRAGKGSIYEGGIRVCAFATWPGRIPAGIVVNEPVHVVDWYPTLLKLAGASLQQTLPIDGKDVWPVITEGAKSPHQALLLCGSSLKNRAVRVGDWKLLVSANDLDTEDAEDAGDDSGGHEKVELYNLADDVGELHNLANENPEKVAEMRAALDHLMKDAVPPGNPPRSASAAKKKGKKKSSK